jgi:hypothetical protein
MTRRIALAAVYTLFVVTLLLTWPWGAPAPQIDNTTVITAIPVARWLVIITPVYWAWAAFSLETRHARRMMLAGSMVLFVTCFLFILQQDAGGPLCLWHSGNCGPGWFN